MTDDNDGFSRDLGNAGSSLKDLAEKEAREAADAIEEAFERAGRAIENSLVRAARTGALSFEAMAQSVLLSISRLAIDRFVSGPLTDVLAGVLKAQPFGGARADGGPVLPGGAYLVGERGPELFSPASAGAVSSAAPGRGGVTVNIHLPPGSDAND